MDQEQNKESKGVDATGPTLLANDKDGAFNCVHHQRLSEIMIDYQIPKYLVQIIDSFNMDRTISMSIDGEAEPETRFQSGLPQGTPLSPVVFILYASAMSKGSPHPTESITSYIGDELMLP